MKKILVSLILVFALFGVSSADIVYTTTTGAMGLVRVTSTSSADLYGVQYNWAADDPFVTAYVDNDGNRRVMLINPTTDTSVSGDLCIRFASTSLSTPLDKETKYLRKVYNTQALDSSNNGESLFCISGSKIYDVDSDLLTLRGSFDCASGEIVPEVLDIVVGDSIFALVDSATTSGDVLMRFDGQLKRNVDMFGEWDINDSSSQLTFLDNDLRLAIAHGEGVDVFDKGIITRAISTDYPVMEVCRDSGSWFFYATQQSQGSNYVYTISHHSGANVNKFADVTINSAVDNLQIIFDNTYNVLGVIAGDELRVYNSTNGNLLGAYSSSQLGGVPCSMAVTNSNSGKSSSSNDSGCRVSSAGIILLLLCSGIFYLKRHCLS